MPARDAVCVAAEGAAQATGSIALAQNVRIVHLFLRELARAGLGLVGPKF